MVITIVKTVAEIILLDGFRKYIQVMVKYHPKQHPVYFHDVYFQCVKQVSII